MTIANSTSFYLDMLDEYTYILYVGLYVNQTISLWRRGLTRDELEKLVTWCLPSHGIFSHSTGQLHLSPPSASLRAL